MYRQFIDYDMLYHNEKYGIELYHIHIPRTAGRFIKQLFSYNSYELYHTDFGILVEGIEVPHLHYPLYNFLENVEESKKFTVVRNPFDRFKSSIKLLIKARSYGDDIYSYLRDESWLVDFLNYERSVGVSYTGNLFRPQHEFISNDTFVYKYEDGINESFVEWINLHLKTNLKYSEVSYPKSVNEESENPNSFNYIDYLIDEKVEKTIKNYYNKDYEVFNYV